MPELIEVQLWRDWYMVFIRHNDLTYMKAAYPDELLDVIARALRDAVNYDPAEAENAYF